MGAHLSVPIRKGYNMAETKEKVAKTENLDELVKYKAFKDNDKYKDDITVIVNGKIWRIQRGVDVEIPRYVLKVIEQSNDQDLKATNYAEQKQNAYKHSSKNFE